MTQTEASCHWVPDGVPPPSGCPVTGLTPFAPDHLADPYAVLDDLQDTLRGPRQLLVAWDA